MAHFGMNGNSSSIFKQFGNLRHTKKPGQYDEEYVEEGFSSMQASQDVDELILHKMIFHSVIVCSAFEEIMVRYDKLARQKEGTETSQERSIDKLTDFGAAEQLDHEEEQFISLYGTEEYLHPDMYDRAVLQTPDPRQLTSKVDIWRSMGVTSFHVAAGQFPFKPCGGRRNRQKIETKEESLVRQEMASELQTITCIEVYEPFSTGSGEHFIAQHTDSKGVKCKDRFSNDLNRTDLKWYFGADNIPWHICVNLLEVLATTAKLDFGISPLCLSIKCLSSYFQDLKIFTFVKTRLRGTKFVNDLLNTEGSGKTGIGCCGQDILQDIPVIDVKDVRGMEEEYMESPTKRVNADMTGYSKVDKEEAQLDGKIETENVNNVVPGRMFGVMLHWIMNTHYKQGYTWIFVMLVLLSNIVSTLEKPVREGTEGTVFHTFQLLKSKVCQNPEENIECPGDNFRFKLKLEFCGYTCASSEEITCMNSAYGMMFFCIPKSTSCSKGIGWQVEGVDGNGLVVIKETNCPEGFYQAEPSKCHNACRTKHESLGIIPEGFIVFKQGDHISPTILMCDSKAGYFSAYNNSFVNYDENFLLHMDFCTHINQSNPCSSGQIPLHNGTCVEPCRPGYERDKTDFCCKQVIDESSTLVPSISGISPSKHITTATQPSTTAQQHGAGVNIGLVIGLIVCAVVIIIIIVCFTVWCVRRRRNRKMRGNNSRNSRTGNHTGPSCTYQAVFRECTDQSGSDLSTASYTEGGRSTTDESTVDVNETPDAAQGTTKLEISPSSESIKVAGGRSTIDESKVDVNETPDAAQGTTKMEISPSSESIKGNRKVVKKSTFNSGNTTINIEKVENLLLGDLDRKVPAVIEGARNISGMIEDLTAEATSDETEMDIKDTDIIQSEQKTVVDQRGCDLVHPNQQQTVSGEPDVTGSGRKGLTGEEFAKGRNELLSQVTVTNFSEHMKSVGALIYNGDVIGTVFRAGDCFIITAFHVVRQIIDINQNGQYDFSLLERGNVWVNFNASVAEPACVVYRVCHQFSSNDPGLDFAVLRIINPWQLPNKMFLDKYNFDRLPARMLSGIGYGHPDQDSKCKKNLDPNCEIIFAIDDRITECRAWLEQNIIYYQNHVRRNGVNPALVANSYIGFDTLRNIFLDITMEHGGSGSPFLDNNGRVVGILTHGHPEFCFKLPKLIQLNFPKGKRFESVLRLDYIYNHIFERDPELAGKLFG